MIKTRPAYRPSRTLQLGVLCLLWLFNPVELFAQCSTCTDSVDYCSVWRTKLAEAKAIIEDVLVTRTLTSVGQIPFWDNPQVRDHLSERYQKYLADFNTMLNFSDCGNAGSDPVCNIPGSCLNGCVLDPPAISDGGNTFDPAIVVTRGLTTQVVHFEFEFFRGVVALPGVDRIVEQNGATSNAYIRTRNGDCNTHAVNFGSARCVAYVMSDLAHGGSCGAAIPNFQGSEIWMVGGTLGISHLHAMVFTIRNHVGHPIPLSEWTMHLPMDAIYTNYYLPMQDYYEAMAEAGMTEQFIDDFFIEHLRRQVLDAAEIFGENSIYHIRVFLDGQQVREYVTVGGKILNLKLTSHYFAGKDRFRASPGSELIGSLVARPGGRYEWNDGTCGSSRTVAPGQTTTYTLTGVSPMDTSIPTRLRCMLMRRTWP